MGKRIAAVLLSLASVIAAAWLGRAGSDDKQPAGGWTEVTAGVFRAPGSPAGYALVDGETALLVDAPQGTLPPGVKKIEAVLLTSYHRSCCAAVGKFLKDGVKVLAPKGAAEWLSAESVRKYWQEAIPLRNSRTAYFIVPVGFDGIDFSLTDGKRLTHGAWTLTVVDTPGHARAHVALAARKGKNGPLAVFCGGALAGPGKLWAPYTTDWDHWTDLGLVPAAKSLRKLADLKPDLLLPAHGPVIDKNAVAALLKTADNVEEAGFLKSFERYTKRLGNPPKYRFLAKEQAGSNGSLPWSQVAEHLFYTGNTWVLVSRDGACLMVDPWGKRSADQFAKLQKDKKLGPLEVVMFSHAHYDHYDGIYDLPKRDQLKVWALDLVAKPIADPYLLRAPFLDERPVRFEATPKDGDTLTWREYRFKFHHLPGQSYYTMGVETTIDGKRCLFTADNWFHVDLYSGTGGWMGLNRGWPSTYAASAQKVLDLAPEWVLAEHGGAFEFHVEDWRRRVAWGKAAAKAIDALSPSGNHLVDWNPHRVRVEPLLQKAKPGAMLKWTLVVENPTERREELKINLDGRGMVVDLSWQVKLPPQGTAKVPFTLKLPERISAGRHIFGLWAIQDKGLDPSDCFLSFELD
jgi:glyoxylase-like metal-dependent hydrolase (beta-lactamase superfamily II)